MNSKRILALTLALSLALAGCSAATTEETATAEATADTEAAELSADSSDLAEKLQVLADENVVSQETVDAIVSYMEANGLTLADEGNGETPPEKPDGDSGSAPEMPDGASGSASGETPPEKPDGSSDSSSDSAPEMPSGSSGSASDSAPEKPDGSSDSGSGSAPEKPDGSSDSGSGETPPELPDGQSGSMPGQRGGTLLSDDVLNELLENSIITQTDYDAIVAYQQKNAMPQGMGGAGGPGGSSADVTYTGATEVSESADLTDGTYSSETADENALLISTGDSVTLSNPTVTKTGDSDGGDTCSFYGVNAGILAMGGANVTIEGGTVTTDANGANGVFSYGGNGGQNGAAGDGTTVTISDTTITTSGDNAGGIMTTGGGTTYASNLTIVTGGRSSAAIRTDRGGGTVVVNGGSYTTNGLGSPSIYSTADISVSDATLVSNLSEGVCIEGKNSVTLTDCDMTVSNTQCNGNATFFDSVIIYQSMSGDADSGTSSFTMTGGSLTSKSGHVFHVTNTHAVITLSGVNIVNEDSGNVLLSVCDDGWSGASNEAELVADAQVLSGAILVGSNSTLTMTLSNGSTFTGSVSGEITNAKGETVSTEVGTVSVTLDSTSTWTLTGDSYVTSFTGDPSQIISNGYTLYVNGTALEGTK